MNQQIKDEEMFHLLVVYLAAAAAGPVSFALRIEPKESKCAKCAEQSDCPVCEAAAAEPRKKHH